jgi:ubiquinone/menaquinone biosynthesis C-methylase UbiE
MARAMVATRRGPALEQRLRASGLREGQVVLDYACGPGYYTVVAARLVGPTGQVTAVDVQPAAAGIVADRARRAGVDNVTTRTSDRDTGLADASVDVALLYDAIAGIADRRGVLAELDRVLKPEGVLSVWVEHGLPEATLPLITENSRFVLRDQHEDVLNFGRG